MAGISGPGSAAAGQDAVYALTAGADGAYNDIQAVGRIPHRVSPDDQPVLHHAQRLTVDFLSADSKTVSAVAASGGQRANKTIAVRPAPPDATTVDISLNAAVIGLAAPPATWIIHQPPSSSRLTAADSAGNLSDELLILVGDDDKPGTRIQAEAAASAAVAP